jgi:hypothetical protein
MVRRGGAGADLWVSKVWLIEALARKRGVNELTKRPTDIGSTPNLFSTLQTHSSTGSEQAKGHERGEMLSCVSRSFAPFVFQTALHDHSPDGKKLA